MLFEKDPGAYKRPGFLTYMKHHCAIMRGEGVIFVARPRKCKRICDLPAVTSFASQSGGRDCVTLTLEEYETIRLIDAENFSQFECARQMEVSRPTVQILYGRARRKLARFLIKGGTLRIEGGDYRVCEHCGKCRHGCGCMKKDESEI